MVRNYEQVWPNKLKAWYFAPLLSKTSHSPPSRFDVANPRTFVCWRRRGGQKLISFFSGMSAVFPQSVKVARRCRHREHISLTHQMCFIGFGVNWLRVPWVQPGDLLMAGEWTLIVTTSQKWPSWMESMLVSVANGTLLGAYKKTASKLTKRGQRNMSIVQLTSLWMERLKKLQHNYLIATI